MGREDGGKGGHQVNSGNFGRMEGKRGWGERMGVRVVPHAGSKLLP